MIKVTEHKISFFDDTETVIIPVVQGDTGRVLKFIPTDATLSGSYTAKWFVRKPSGLAVYYNATISGNSVQCALTAQALAEKGDSYLNIRIYDTNQDVVSAFRVLLKVQESPVDALESTNETNIFDQAIEEAIEEIGNTLDTSLSIHNKAAESASVGDRFDTIIKPYGTNKKSIKVSEVTQHNGENYMSTVVMSSLSHMIFDSSDWEKIVLGDVITKLCNSFKRGYLHTATYNTGQYVAHMGGLYRCKEDGVTGTWDNTKWQAINVMDEVQTLMSNITLNLGEDEDGFITISLGES